ncbi:hypothetical protein C1I36_12525 [Dehalobacter sp. 14DCB1]|nr:hypothetical protein C1I36_12525 [Dehalobacter sp. 14DCB1]
MLGALIGGTIGVVFMCLFQINTQYRRNGDKN